MNPKKESLITSKILDTEQETKVLSLMANDWCARNKTKQSKRKKGEKDVLKERGKERKTVERIRGFWLPKGKAERKIGRERRSFETGGRGEAASRYFNSGVVPLLPPARSGFNQRPLCALSPEWYSFVRVFFGTSFAPTALKEVSLLRVTNYHLETYPSPPLSRLN